MPVDHRGAEISIGKRVAYNWQGQVAYGEVVAVKKKFRYGVAGFTIEIVPLAPAHLTQRQAISTVTNPLNLLVLNENLPG